MAYVQNECLSVSRPDSACDCLPVDGIFLQQADGRMDGQILQGIFTETQADRKTEEHCEPPIDFHEVRRAIL